MDIETVQKRLRDAHARIGFEGRFALTIDQSPDIRDGRAHDGCYITHWFRPTPYAFEDCRAIASGDIAGCLDALDAYVTERNAHRAPTQGDLAATLGIDPLINTLTRMAAE